MLAEGLIHLHFMSPYTLFRNNSQTQQGLTVPEKIYTPRFQCGEYNMLVLLSESKGNKKKMPFHFEKAITQIHGLWSSFPLLLPSDQLEVLRARGRVEGAYITHPVLTCFLPHPNSAFPGAKGEGHWLSPRKISPSLTYIWAFSDTCSTALKCTNAKRLRTYCQVNRGSLQLKSYFRQKECKKARKGKREDFCGTVEMLGIWPKSVFATSQSFAYQCWHSCACCHIPRVYHLLNFFFKPIYSF